MTFFRSSTEQDSAMRDRFEEWKTVGRSEEKKETEQKT